MNIDWSEDDDEINSLYGDIILDINKEGLDTDGYNKSIAIENESIKKMIQRGIFHNMLPKEYGGKDCGELKWGLILEKIGYISNDISVPFILSVRMSFILALISANKNGIANKYIDRLINGDIFGSFAYSEGQDAFSFLSQAQYQASNETYIINGVKHYITGGETADLFIVFVRGDSVDLQAFLIERDDIGVSVEPKSMHGMRTAGISKLTLNNVVVDKSRLLIDTDALSFAQSEFLNKRRAILLTFVLGKVRAVLDIAIQYLDKTVRYGQSIIDLQYPQALIGKAMIALESARTFVFYSLQKIEQGKAELYWDAISSMAKCYGTEQVNYIATMAMKLTGGWGYTEESGIGRILRDVAALFAGADPQTKLEVDIGINAIHHFQMHQYFINQE